MADTVKIKINGKEYEAKKGETILDVARRNGVYIPAICYSDRFGAIGACRICAVEIVGMKKPMLSCAFKVKDGMEVLTDSEKVIEQRKKIVWEWDKFHPLQCGVCDKSGECDLQDINYELNITENPLEEEADPLSVPNRSIHHEWRIIHHDANLCIQCRRCVTICDKVVNFGILAMVKKEWGGREVDTKDGKPLECEFCGQCVSICPTGAMSSKLFKYKARPWEMEKVPTTCQFCASGCQMDLNVKDNKVLRVTSKDDTPNLANLCNLGRFNYSVIDRRLSDYYVNGRQTTKESALDKAVKLISSTKPENIAAICGGRETVEDQLMLRFFLDDVVKSNNVDSFASTHIAKLYSVLPEGVAAFNNIRDMEDCDLIFAFGGDFANEMPRLDWQITRNVKLLGVSKLITAYWRDTKIDTLGSNPLRYAVGDELKFLNSLAANLSKALGVDIPVEDGGYEIAQETLELISSAKKVAFVVGQEALERPFGDEIAKAISNLLMLVKDKVRLYVSSKYNNAYGAIFSGLTNGFGLFGKKTERVFNIYDLKEKVLDGSVKTLILMNADLHTLFSDSDVDEISSKANIILFDSYPSRMTSKAAVVLPTTTFAATDGHYINIEGKLNRVSKAIDEGFETAYQLLVEMAEKLGTKLGMGKVQEALKGEFAIQPSVESFVSTSNSSFEFAEEFKGALIYSKFRSGIFSSFGDGASIASPEGWVELSKTDAEKLGVSTGDRVTVSGEGSIEAVVRVDEAQPEGVAGVTLWYDGLNGFNVAGSLNNLFSAKITKGE
ncbi:2Fe-2S iron-sulfur cluster-binding protein [Hippea jasoniae]|uniref:2Fe-2S iron-sulfur cluster-binding protein n=1 Tax=Hippea jasoniae TaxID=944479 RepID=UPI0005592C4A|nr:2Fe-2S iron-sulfur cluster-binding protein [Hippea jasoniae]